MSIGQNIKQRRRMLDMTLEDVAKDVGVSRQTLSRYETGVIGNIPSDKIELLAKSLRTTPAYLMGWEDEKGVTDIGLVAIEIAKKYGLDASVVYDAMDNLDRLLPIDEQAIIAEVKRMRPTPVSESGPIDPRDKKFLELFSQLTPDQKELVLAQLRVLKERQ